MARRIGLIQTVIGAKNKKHELISKEKKRTSELNFKRSNLGSLGTQNIKPLVSSNKGSFEVSRSFKYDDENIISNRPSPRSPKDKIDSSRAILPPIANSFTKKNSCLDIGPLSPNNRMEVPYELFQKSTSRNQIVPWGDEGDKTIGLSDITEEIHTKTPKTMTPRHIASNPSQEGLINTFAKGSIANLLSSSGDIALPPIKLHDSKEINTNRSKPESMYASKEVETKEEKSKRVRARWRGAINKIILGTRIMSRFRDVKNEAQLFGTSKYKEPRIEEDYSTRTKHYICLILPESKFKFIWSGIMIFLLLFSGIYIPLRVAFYDKVHMALLTLEYIFDALFLADIFINFISAYYNGDHIMVTSHCTIAKNYITGWFMIDIVACFPFQFLDNDSENSGQYNKLLRLLRLGRMYRLLRILVLLRMSKFFRENKVYEKLLITFKMNDGIKRLITALFAISFLFHIFGCMWFFLAKMNDFNPDTWVVRYGFRDAKTGEQYLVSLYWVLTLCTVGYGDLNPYTVSERLAAMVFMLFGVAVYTYTIGSLTTFLSQSDSKNRRLKSKLLALDDYALSIGMPHELYYRIKRTIKANHQMEYYSSVDQENLLEELPAAMRAEVITLTHRKTLDKIAFFKGKNPNFLLDILPTLKRLSLSKGEVIFSEGDWADERRVQLISRDGYIFMTYIEGSYMGDAELLTEHEFRTCSLITAENCELLILKRGDLLNILSEYPDIKFDMINIINARIEKNKKCLITAKKEQNMLDDYENILGRGKNNMMNKSYFGHKPTMMPRKKSSLSFATVISLSSRPRKNSNIKTQESKLETQRKVNSTGNESLFLSPRTNSMLFNPGKHSSIGSISSNRGRNPRQFSKEDNSPKYHINAPQIIFHKSFSPQKEKGNEGQINAPRQKQSVEEAKQCDTPVFPMTNNLVGKSTLNETISETKSEDESKDNITYVLSATLTEEEKEESAYDDNISEKATIRDTARDGKTTDYYEEAAYALTRPIIVAPPLSQPNLDPLRSSTANFHQETFSLPERYNLTKGSTKSLECNEQDGSDKNEDRPHNQNHNQNNNHRHVAFKEKKRIVSYSQRSKRYKNQRMQTENIIESELNKKITKFKKRLEDIFSMLEDCSADVRLMKDDNEDMLQKIISNMNKKLQKEEYDKHHLLATPFVNQIKRKATHTIKEMLEFENRIEAQHIQ